MAEAGRRKGLQFTPAPHRARLIVPIFADRPYAKRIEANGDYHRFLQATKTSQTLRHTPLLITEIRGSAGFGYTPDIAFDNAYVLQLRMLDCPQSSYFLSGRPVPQEDRRAGVLQFLDLRLDPTVLLLDPFHVMQMYVPRATLTAAAEEACGRPLHNLSFEHGGAYRDETLANLLCALRPYLARPEDASSLLIEHIAQAVCLRLVQRFGTLAMPQRAFRGGFASWQAMRASDMIESNLGGDVSLAHLASECGLSVRHFSRAFVQAFGMPAHRYLTVRRIELALELLKVKKLSLPEIALKCGFSDQSHLTRVFTRHVGSSPGQWRRQH